MCVIFSKPQSYFKLSRRSLSCKSPLNKFKIVFLKWNLNCLLCVNWTHTKKTFRSLVWKEEKWQTYSKLHKTSFYFQLNTCNFNQMHHNKFQSVKLTLDVLYIPLTLEIPHKIVYIFCRWKRKNMKTHHRAYPLRAKWFTNQFVFFFGEGGGGRVGIAIDSDQSKGFHLVLGERRTMKLWNSTRGVARALTNGVLFYSV